MHKEVPSKEKKDLCKLRCDLIKKRRALSGEELLWASREVCKRLLEHPLLKDGMKKIFVGSYSAIGGEIDTRELNHSLRDRNFRVVLPRVTDKNQGLMEFYECPEQELITGSFGIMEPSAAKHHMIDPDCISVLLMPLTGFDGNGNRLGMGGGFYDRYLKRLSERCVLIGLAHDFQQIDQIESREWDMPLHEIVTPKRHLICENVV